jgi:nucleolar protein 56
VEERLRFYDTGETPRKNLDVMKEVMAELASDELATGAKPKEGKKADKADKGDKKEKEKEKKKRDKDGDDDGPKKKKYKKDK